MSIENLKINKEHWEKTALDESLSRDVREEAAKNAAIAAERIAKKKARLGVEKDGKKSAGSRKE